MTFWKKNEIPQKDYYAVIFCSTKSQNLEGYAETDEYILNLAMVQKGFLGYESAGDLSAGIFISYWETMDDIQNWRNNPEHIKAKKQGIDLWYNRFLSQICKVEHSHHFVRNERNS